MVQENGIVSVPIEPGETQVENDGARVPHCSRQVSPLGVDIPYVAAGQLWLIKATLCMQAQVALELLGSQSSSPDLNSKVVRRHAREILSQVQGEGVGRRSDASRQVIVEGLEVDYMDSIGRVPPCGSFCEHGEPMGPQNWAN
jgi:hypothetical protein